MFGFKIYEETPMCPICGSSRTGQYIIANTMAPNGKIKEITRAKKNGELIRYTDSASRMEYNCFCDDCDYRWYGDIKTKVINSKNVKKKRDEKGIYSLKIEKEYTVIKESKVKRVAKKAGKNILGLIPFSDELFSIKRKK